MNARQSTGFTFLEVIIALAILVILMTVILHSSAALIRASKRLRVSEESRLVQARIAGEAWMSTSGVETVGQGIEGWTVQYESVVAGEGVDQAPWYHWTISPSNNIPLGVELYLRPPVTNKPAAQPPAKRSRRAFGG